MTKDGILKYLKENFGIKSERELYEAIATAKRLNVGIMTKGTRTNDSNTRIK